MASTIIIYEGDGTRTDFTVPFDYLKKSFVTVRLDPSTTLTGGDYGDAGSDYYFLDKTTIRLKVAPASGKSLTIRRHTSATERVVTFKDASILKATDLDTSQMQAFHIAEEGRDAINDAIIGDKEGNWDAKGHRIINVGTPIKDNDASSTGTSVYDAGDFDGRSIGELKKELKNFISASDGTATNKIFVFYAHESFITCWNNDSGTLRTGPTWEVMITCFRAPLQRAALLFTSHIHSAFVLGILDNGALLALQPISCKKWSGTLQTTHAVLTSTWNKGTSWYRKYSDGWIEQGGEFTKNRDTNTTVTFPVAFKDTNYTIATSQYAQHSNNPPVCSFTSKTNTGITHNYGSWGSKWGWFACGY